MYRKEVMQTDEKDMERFLRLTAVIDVLEGKFGHHVGSQPELEDQKDPCSDLIVLLQFEGMQSNGSLRIPYEGELRFEGGEQVAIFFMKYCVNEYRELLIKLF